MDVFSVRDKVIDDYRSFTTASIDIKDARLQEHYQRELDGDSQWPEPWISLNPAFETGGRIDELVQAGLLHPECDRIFRVKQHLEDTGRAPFTLHRHQREAIEVARSGESYVLTTGTGSGKSLAYIVPIVDHVLRQPRTLPVGHLVYAKGSEDAREHVVRHAGVRIVAHTLDLQAEPASLLRSVSGLVDEMRPTVDRAAPAGRQGREPS